jgi:type 1 fimbria pilin
MRSPKLKLSLLALVSLIAAIATVSCSQSGGGSGGPGGLGKPGGGTCSTQPALAANITGGCQIRMVTPGDCAEVDLTNGKLFEFAWTTDGTGCETPFKIMAAGSPPTAENSVELTVPTNGAAITRQGGLVNVTLAELKNLGLTSDNGEYHWVVMSFHGSHPQSQVFRVRAD